VFGNGVFPSSMKGVPPAPVTKVRDHLARHGRVVLVNEFRTSITCSRCFARMKRHEQVHTTMHCANHSDSHQRCPWSWNRDVNAARNIALIFKVHMAGEDRPRAFRRGT